MKVFYTAHLTRTIEKVRPFFVLIKTKFWWIDVIYPIALAILIFGFLTYIVYGGRESTRLSLLGERFLLEQSLRLTPDFHLKKIQRPVTISADPVTMNRLSKGNIGLTPDFSSDLYARVIERLAENGLKDIVIMWRSENHPQDPEYYLGLRQTLQRLRGQINVIFVTNLSEINGIKRFIGDLALVLDNVPCASAETDEVQTFCPILDQNQDWIAQWLYRKFYFQQDQDPIDSSLKKNVIGYLVPSWKTGYLPSTVEAYITRMNQPKHIEDLSFEQLLNGDVHLAALSRIAFVGVELNGAVGGHTHPSMPVAINLPSPFWEQPRKVSLHKYWASLTQSFMQHKIPIVASPILVWLLNVTIGFSILFLMYRFGGIVASVTFIIWCLVSPLLNILLIYFTNFYLPIFNSYYLGLSLLTISGFCRLSYSALERWRVEEKSRSHLHAADLKANFISLLSHNINTPIAKMQGMLDLLTLNSSGYHSADLQCAGFYVAQLQLVVKSVLVATTLEEKAVQPTRRNAQFFLADFQSNFGPLIRQSGLKVEIMHIGAENEDILQLPLAFDARVVSTILAAVLGLAASLDRPHANIEEVQAFDQQKRLIQIIPSLGESKDFIDFRFSFHIQAASAKTFRQWFAEAKIRESGFRGVKSEDFVRGVLVGYILLALDFYMGFIEIQEQKSGSEGLQLDLCVKTFLG